MQTMRNLSIFDQKLVPKEVSGTSYVKLYYSLLLENINPLFLAKE
jgi:hypothetical protein